MSAWRMPRDDGEDRWRRVRIPSEIGAVVDEIEKPLVFVEPTHDTHVPREQEIRDDLETALNVDVEIWDAPQVVAGLDELHIHVDLVVLKDERCTGQEVECVLDQLLGCQEEES